MFSGTREDNNATGDEILRWDWVVAAAVFVEMRQLYAVQAGARACATRDTSHGWVLPGSLEVQMWQQVVHAVTINIYILFIINITYVF